MSLDLKSENELRQIDIVKIYNNKKCLIVDDFPEIRGSLTRTLRTFGVNSVDTAANGEEAIRACSFKKYDIVLCDYNLGAGKDGQQILEEVRYLRVLLMTSLFVMITGESSREMVLGALECQPDDYITKPYTQQSLRVRLNKAIVRHETLLPIKKFISDGDYRAALDTCNQMIADNSRYAGDCLKIKGQLHFLLKQLKEAQKLYESVLGKKPLVWAKLGMGKTQLALGNYDSAEEILNSIIEEDERYVEAHDLLAEVHKERKDLAAAQRATENATRVSPKSVLRHRQLAELADQNNDDEIALKSHQNAIKWGFNSCHESEQDYFNYARKVSEVVQGDNSSNAKNLTRQGHNFLDRARKRFADRPEIAVQAQLVEIQLHLGSGEQKKAEAAVDKAREMYNDLATPPVETSLEMARTLHAMNNEDEARELLTHLAARHENDPDILQMIDGITGEPISDKGKVVATKLTKAGIEHYETKNFAEAIDVFMEALANYPKHIGLNLNLIQAILADTEANGFSERYEKLCRRSLRAVGTVGPDHKQHKRYAFLTRQLGKHYPNVT
ncbi:tetratricopeptide repeat-containing response regulator [Teredinibacter turnerae]|uniref:tetratricopeptide repeat-containing response regulator n=1 Tax=Teredinibacter turnerae TaxID=2426 RepID=UPI000418B583|nr:tetratricopeptide repeat-containing response regulator [Teredinibacter turnerae]